MSEEVKYIRYERLIQVCSKALEESQKVLSDDNLGSCFPTLVDTAEGRQLIQTIKSQLINTWKNNTLKEFEAIYTERNIERKLNELDELITAAQIRKNGNEGDEIPIDQLTSSNIIASHLIPLKEQNVKKLTRQFEALQQGNVTLLQELNGKLEEASSIKSDVMTTLESINKLNQLGEESNVEQNLNKLVEIISKREL